MVYTFIIIIMIKTLSKGSVTNFDRIELRQHFFSERIINLRNS